MGEATNSVLIRIVHRYEQDTNTNSSELQIQLSVAIIQRAAACTDQHGGMLKVGRRSLQICSEQMSDAFSSILCRLGIKKEAFVQNK